MVLPRRKGTTVFFYTKRILAFGYGGLDLPTFSSRTRVHGNPYSMDVSREIFAVCRHALSMLLNLQDLDLEFLPATTIKLVLLTLWQQHVGACIKKSTTS